MASSECKSLTMCVFRDQGNRPFSSEEHIEHLILTRTCRMMLPQQHEALPGLKTHFAVEFCIVLLAASSVSITSIIINIYF